MTDALLFFLLLLSFFQGEKAYSCGQCGTRFTYRNGLIKHTKLNRCPKKIVTPEGETIIKKRSRSVLNRNNKDCIKDQQQQQPLLSPLKLPQHPTMTPPHQHPPLPPVSIALPSSPVSLPKLSPNKESIAGSINDLGRKHVEVPNFSLENNNNDKTAVAPLDRKILEAITRKRNENNNSTLGASSVAQTQNEFQQQHMSRLPSLGGNKAPQSVITNQVWN